MSNAIYTESNRLDTRCNHLGLPLPLLLVPFRLFLLSCHNSRFSTLFVRCIGMELLSCDVAATHAAVARATVRSPRNSATTSRRCHGGSLSNSASRTLGTKAQLYTWSMPPSASGMTCMMSTTSWLAGVLFVRLRCDCLPIEKVHWCTGVTIY